MQKNKVYRLVLFAFAIFILFPSCSGSKNNKTQNELSFGFTTEPATLDPLNPQGTADGRSILFNVFEGLVKPDSSGNMQPCIAESWTIDNNSVIYTFNIRENIRFHDNSLLTAADVKFSLDTAITAGFSGLNGIQSIETTGSNQIKITLKNPDPEFIPYLSLGIVKANNTDREKNVFGTGPFFIESYSPQQNLILKKFDNYWQKDAPHLDKVTFVFFANFDTLLLALRGGSIDGTFLTGPMAAQLNKNDFDFFHSYSAAVHLLALNNDRAPLNDTRIRLALNYGIDIQGIIDSAFFGEGVPSGSPIIPGLTEYYNAGLSYQYDPDTARMLLSQAGFGENGSDFSFEITVPSNYAMHIDTAQVIASQLEKIGVKTSIKLVDWATWLNDVYINRQYMATIISLDSPVVSPKSFLSRYHSQSSSNFINFRSASFDRTFDAITAETNQIKRAELYKEAQHLITSNAASVYIQDIYYFKVFKAGFVSGVLNYPLYVIDFASMYRIE